MERGRVNLGHRFGKRLIVFVCMRDYRDRISLLYKQWTRTKFWLMQTVFYFMLLKKDRVRNSKLHKVAKIEFNMRVFYNSIQYLPEEFCFTGRFE